MTKRVAKPIENDLDEELEDEIEEEAYDDDDEEYEYEERSRAIPIAVVSVALALFVALGWYAYRESTTPSSDELLTVEAEQTPIKERPLDEGGMQFPNQDKSVYETIGDNNASQNTQVVDSSEAPMNIAEAPVATQAVPVPSTSVIEAPSAVVTPSEEPAVASAPIAEETTSAPVVATENALATPANPASSEAPLVKEQAPVAEKPVAEKSETIAATPKATTKKEPVKKAEAAKKPAATTSKAASGSQVVQLGAFKSEAEAQAAWKKLSSNPAISGKPHSVQKADLGDKGIFYRLRVNGVDAVKTCASLAGKSPCMAVK